MLKYLAVFFMAMLPILEIQGAMPVGLTAGLPYLETLLVAILGNMVPVPFVYLFGRKILTWGSKQKHIGPFCEKMMHKGEAAGRKMAKKTGRFGIAAALTLFVGIPLPGTGAWTGTLAASFLDIGFKTTTAAVCVGVVIAGTIIGIASGGLLHILGL